MKYIMVELFEEEFDNFVI